MNKQKLLQELNESAMPLIEFMNKNYHPHVKCIVTPTGVELLEGLMSNQNIYDFTKD